LNQRLTEAEQAFLAARATWQALQKEFGPRTTCSSLEARTELYLCRVYQWTNRRNDGLAAGRHAIDIYRNLVHDHPEDYEFGHQLNLAHQEVGFLQLNAGVTDLAIHELEQARQTLEQMAASHAKIVSTRARILGELAKVDYNVRVATDADMVRYDALKRAVITESYEICDKLSLVEPLTLELRRVYADGCFNLALYHADDGGQVDIRLLEKAEQLWEGIRAEAPEDMVARGFLVIIRRKLALVLAADGNEVAASRWRAQSLSTARGQGELFYEIALEYVRMLGPIDRVPGKLAPSVRQARRQQVVDDTMAMLREAIADGFHDAKRLRTEEAFSPIRHTPEFQATVAGLEFPKN
jgi:hypothetical protein